MRVRFGKFRGAHGKVRQMHSRFGRTVIELDPDDAARYDQIEVGAWRLAPPRSSAPTEIDLRGAVSEEHDSRR